MNRNYLLVSLVAIGFATVSPAQEKPEVKPEATVKEIPKSGQPGQDSPKVVDGGSTKTESGNSWFPVTDLDLGTYFGSEVGVGVFRFKNPTDKPVAWKSMQGSCTCTRAVFKIGDRRYEMSSKPTPNMLVRVRKDKTGPEQNERVEQITIEPGEEGEVEVHIEMHGVQGVRQATLDVHTDDEKLQQFKLKWHATGAQMFVVSPAEVNLNKMTWNEMREFTVTVSSPLNKDFNITRMDDAGKAFTVAWEKAMSGENAVWTIRGKYGPVDSETAGGGGVLKFYTDVRGESTFMVRVMAFVQGPLEVKPGGFLPLGLIRKGNALVKEIVFEPNDGTKLEATKMTFEKLSVPEEFVSVTSKQDGGKLIVSMSISAQAPTGMMKGELVVQLNHPLVKEKRIMFNGFVR